MPRHGPFAPFRIKNRFPTRTRMAFILHDDARLAFHPNAP
jgi:hypothetical protein